MSHITFPLLTSGGEPYYLQLYRHILKEIQKGGLQAGEKLPSKRTLAQHLSVSVNTVDAAYQMLTTEGYLRAAPKSGFYVCPLSVPLSSVPASSLLQPTRVRTLLCENISENCYLGEELDAYQVTGEGEIEAIEYRLYPVFSDEKIVALAQVVENSQGEETVSCITAYAGELQAYYEKNPNEKVAIVFAQDGVYIYCQRDKSQLKFTQLITMALEK